MHHRGRGRPGDDTGGVSRIRRLESRLGVILFLRGGRGVTLTEAGRQLFDRVEPSLRVLSDAMMEIDTQASPRSRLTVRSVSTLATRWLIPKLPEFNQQIPNVRVVLQPYAPDDDFLDTQTDCWIVPRPPKGNPWPRHVMATYLAGQHIVPICHPDLAPQILARRPFAPSAALSPGATGRLAHLAGDAERRAILLGGFRLQHGRRHHRRGGRQFRRRYRATLPAGRGPEDAARGCPSRTRCPLTAATIFRAATIRSWTRSRMAAAPRAAGSERLLTPGPAAVRQRPFRQAVFVPAHAQVADEHIATASHA